MASVSAATPPPARGRTLYFSATGCVVEYPDRRDVFVGGSLIGAFTADDRAMRNMLIVSASQSEGVSYGKLAKAFGVSVGTVNNVRRRFEKGGIQAIVKPGGKPRKLTPKLIEQLGKLFDKGLTIDEAHKKIRKRVSRTLVGRAHKHWADAKKEREAKEQCEQQEKSPQLSLEERMVRKAERRARRSPAPASTPAEAGNGNADDDGTGSEELGLERSVARGGEHVQHLGAWIMLVMLHALGVYTIAEALRSLAQKLAPKSERFVRAATLRVVIDAVAISLVIGEGSVEGVRRIGTPSAPTLLRYRHAITPSWARRVLGRFAEEASDAFHMALATALVRQTEELADERAVFYVDNHMRPYSGKFTVRKGWRMQDKRARPGISDYWIHDEDGRPVMRVNSPEHGSLVSWLLPIGEALRNALAEERVRVLMVFDRAGAHVEAMAQLRDAGFEFVTYERKPYAQLPVSSFDQWIEIGEERYEFTEPNQKNLGKRRGRVRRIVVRSPEGEQFNILAVSEAPAHELVAHLLARWARQENQFKHGVERWGLNQLDGRRVKPYPPDDIIPNPARNRIDRALRLARAAEGEALRQLERLASDHPKREKFEQDVARARAEQEKLEAIRPHVPTHAPVQETELAGKLVKHKDTYKQVLDTLRIALANVESELAARLAPQLPRHAEAKKTLANLLTAPGTVHVNSRVVTVTLAPAGTSTERLAFDSLLAELNASKLPLPGDVGGRRLQFKLQKT